MSIRRSYLSGGVEAHFEDYNLLRAQVMSSLAPELEHLGLSETFSALLGVANLAIASEMEHRKAARLEILGRTTEEIVVTANMYNDMAVRHAKGALSSFQAARRAWDPAAVEQYTDLFKSAEGREALAEARGYFGHHLALFDFLGEEMVEILKAWDDAQGIAISEGVQGLADYLENQINALIEARQSPTRGTEPGSPLPVWKIVLIVITLAIAIGAVIECFAKRGCAEIFTKLLSVAPALGSLIAAGC